MDLLLLIIISNLWLTFSQCPNNSSSGDCTSNLLMVDNKVCVQTCPSNYTPKCVGQVSVCTSCELPSSPLLFQLDFSSVQDLSATYIASSIDSSDHWRNGLSGPFSDSSKYTPLPTLDRGFWFVPNSLLISNKNYIPSLYFTVNTYIRYIGPGVFLTAMNGSNTYVYCIIDSTASINIIGKESISGQNIDLKYGDGSFNSAWQFITLQIKQVSCNSVNLYIYKDKALIGSKTFSNAEANFPSGTYTWVIGGGFQGFLYYIDASNDCSFASFALSTPLTICDNNWYWSSNESQCKLCGSSCHTQTWPWCIRGEDCSICYSSSCSACTGYAPNMCSTCSTGLLPNCCDWLALTCKSTWESTSCNTGKFLIGGVCLHACPYGFGNCAPVSNPVITADFTGEFKGTYDTILVTGADGSTYNFWNSPEPCDPIPAKGRGLWFVEGSYLEAKIDLSYEFAIELWIYADTGSYLQFAKTLNYIDISEDINIFMYDSTGSISYFTETWNPFPNLEWHYLLYNMKFDKGMSTFTSYKENSFNTAITGVNRVFRPDAGSSLFLGSQNFRGFISYFQLWQVSISDFPLLTKFLVCDGQGEYLNCLWPCDINQYCDENGCGYVCTCLGGCVRANSCNICDSELCLECSSFLPDSCTLCVDNSSGGSCDCNTGFYQPAGQPICSSCYSGCSHCTGSFYYQCTSCISNYYYFSITKMCLSDCPLGYTKSSSECLLTSELAFNLNLNTLNGVVYDSASLIPVVTGSSEQFYPDYEDDDPISAYLRGFYFNGISSVMRLPEYQTYTSPKLKIGPVFTISIWLNIENENSALISKNDVSNSYSTIYKVYLIDSKPTIKLFINNSLFLYACQVSLIVFEWSHLAFQVNIDNSGNTIVICYVNTSPDPSSTLGFGYFQDINSNAISLIGAQQTSQDIKKFFKGFLYEIKIYNSVYSIALLSQTSCFESCSVCPTNGSCIPNCKINEFWKEPEYNKCSNCNSNCKNGCKDSQTSCSACYSPLCDTCIDYSSTGCIACKSNASFENNSCICDINYVFDNSNSCISVPAGGYRGSDGLFYPCPNLCLTCESSLICNSCVNHASLNNNLCNCNNGYNGTTTCTYVPFSVNLIVFLNDSLSLSFSDPLQNVLAISNIAISIENDPQFTWNLEQINTTNYNIPMSIKDEIPQNTLINVTFIDLTEVKSIWNGMLKSSLVSSKLNEYDPNPYSLVVDAITSRITSCVQGAVIGSAAMSLITPNPSALWGLLNCLQILSYLSLSGIPFSSKMTKFLSNLNSYSMIPNIFEFIIDEKEGNKASNEEINFGYNTDLILLNQGDDFTIIASSIIFLPFVVYLAGCSYRWVGKRFKDMFKAYKYSFYIRFWIQCYLELGAAASVGLVFKFNNPIQIINFIICFGVFLLFAVSPFAFLSFSYKNWLKIQRRVGDFNALFSSFFYEFRTEKGVLYSLYYFVYFLRRLIYVANLVFLVNYPKTQVSINIICSLMSIFYILVYWPFKDQILQISNLISELLVGIIMCANSFYLFDVSSSIISDVENAIIFISLFIIGTQFITSLGIFSRTLYQNFRYKIIHNRKTRFSIHPIKNNLDVL